MSVVLEDLHVLNERRGREGEVLLKRKTKMKGRRKKGSRPRRRVVETGKADEDEDDKTGGEVRQLLRRIMDIKDFFIKVPRRALMKRLREVNTKIQERFEGVHYFGVERIPRMMTECRIPRSPLDQ